MTRDMERTARRRVLIVLAVCILALVLRVGLMVAKPDLGANDRLDSITYTRIAHNLLHGGGFSINGTTPTMFVGPGYPAVIVGMYAVFGEHDLPIKLLQALLGALTVGLIFLTTRLMFGDRAAIVASLLAAVHPELIAISAFLYTETVFIALLAAGVFLILLGITRKSIGLLICAGIILGLDSLCRGMMVPFPAFMLVALLAMRIPWKRAFVWTVVVGVAMALVISPWAYRNYRLSHKLVPVSVGFGLTFWQGNYQPFDGRYRYEETQKRAAEIAGDTMGQERDDLLMEAALDGMRKNPGAAAWLMVRKVGRLWFEVYENVPSGAKRTTDTLIMLVLGVWHYFLLACGAVGLVACRRADDRLKLIYVLLVFVTLVHAATLAVPRYRLPMMPYITMFAGCGILVGWDRVVGRAFNLIWKKAR